MARRSHARRGPRLDTARPVVLLRERSCKGAQTSTDPTLHPSGDYLYISNSSLTSTSAAVPIYDITDPANPVLVNTFSAPGNQPHDVRFNEAGDRAYLAGISQYGIVDTSDPENPTLISTIVPPGGTIGHDTLVSLDGAFLFLGDEAGGGLTYPCPGGAVYVYDIQNEQAPILLGALEAGVGPVTNRTLDSTETGSPTSCTSHVMELNPDGKSLTLGWYGAGSRVLDFSGLYIDDEPAPIPAGGYGDLSLFFTETAWIIPDGGSTWSAKQCAPLPGYVFSDDLNVGFYVSRFVE